MRSMASNASVNGIAAIVGVGPKLGRSIARKFAREGYTIAILARDLGRYPKTHKYTPNLLLWTWKIWLQVKFGLHFFSIFFLFWFGVALRTWIITTGRLSRFADEIAREEKAQVFAIRIDCSESRSIREAFEGVLSLGFVEVLVYNAYHPESWNPTSFADIRLDHFEKSLAVSAVGAFHCAQQVSFSIFTLSPHVTHVYQMTLYYTEQ